MMKKYEIGLYEKAMRNTLSWSEKIGCAKECGYDYMEMCIDATDEKINRIFMDTAEKKKIMEAVFQAGLPIGSMSVSALTKYALGDPDEEIRKKAMQIAEKSIELAVDLGVRTEVYDRSGEMEHSGHGSEFILQFRNDTKRNCRQDVYIQIQNFQNAERSKRTRYCRNFH